MTPDRVNMYVSVSTTVLPLNPTSANCTVRVIPPQRTLPADFYKGIGMFNVPSAESSDREDS